MRILFFSSYFYPYISGLTTYPMKILNYLSKKHQIKILTFPHQPSLPSKEKLARITIYRLPFLFKLSKGYISPQSLLFFYKEIKKSDLIILNIPNFEGLPLAIMGKLLNKKILSIFHCQVDLGSRILSKIINFFLNISVFSQLFLSETIIAYTQDYVDNLWISKVFQNKIKIILPPVQKLSINPKKYKQLQNLKTDKIWIGYAGRIAQEKGLEYLIEALTYIKTKYKNIELLFAGPFGKEVVGEKQYFLKIKQLLTKQRVCHHFLGNLNEGNLGAFYKSIDILILPSINKTEAFGMVQPEAMLLGVPVIATNLPGVRISIKLTSMGILVEPKNITQLSNAIEEILKNKHKYSNQQLVINTQKIFDINKTYQFYNILLR